MIAAISAVLLGLSTEFRNKNMHHEHEHELGKGCTLSHITVRIKNSLWIVNGVNEYSTAWWRWCIFLFFFCVTHTLTITHKYSCEHSINHLKHSASFKLQRERSLDHMTSVFFYCCSTVWVKTRSTLTFQLKLVAYLSRLIWMSHTFQTLPIGR